MELPYTLETFTPHVWENIFRAFVLANKSHWRGAPYDAVINLLKTKGRFEFSVTGMNTWTNKFVLTTLENGHIDAAFIPNTALSPLMQKHLVHMAEQFYEQLERL